MKKFLPILFILLLLPISYSEEFGLGVQPSLLNVTLGNETETDNDIIYEFEIRNTGDIKINVRMVPEAKLSNFTLALTQDLKIDPHEKKNFLVRFSRDGTEYKEVLGRLRFKATPDENVPPQMVNVEPAVDAKISLIQLEMEKDNRRLHANLLMGGLLLLCAVVIGGVILWAKGGDKEDEYKSKNT
jgi:hypothetical protein